MQAWVCACMLVHACAWTCLETLILFYLFCFCFHMFVLFSFFFHVFMLSKSMFHMFNCLFVLTCSHMHMHSSMLVGSVKGFAFKSINLTTPLEYICLIMYGPAQFCLNFSFASWIGAQISSSTKSPNLKSMFLTILSKAFLSLLW